MIDLGDWAAERYRVPTAEGPKDDQQPGSDPASNPDAKPEE